MIKKFSFLLFFCLYFSNSFALLEKQTQRGPVSVKLQLSPEKPVIGDNITLYLEVTAEPEVELLMPEFAQALSQFSIVDFVPGEKIDHQGKTLATQKYTLAIPHSGALFIPPLTIEFIDHRKGMRAAPEDEDAYEILTERIDFSVESIAPEDAGDSLKPPLAELLPEPEKTVKDKSFPLALLLILLLLVVAVVFWWRKYWQKSRRENAWQRARKKLDILLQQAMPTEKQQVDQLFVQLSNIVRHYLEDRFLLHAPELTTEEFLDVAAKSPDLSAQHCQFLRDFLQRADQVKFAGLVPEHQDIQHTFDAIDNFLEQTKPAGEEHAA